VQGAHFSVSLVAPDSQGSPHWFWRCSISRCRKRWPPHLVQSPHSDQTSHLQSRHTSAAHGSVLHGAVSASSSWHGGPSLAAGLRIWRERLFWPPSHDVLHFDHSSQVASLHARSGSRPHVVEGCSPWAGLHGETSFRLSLKHVLPLPEANCVMRRSRSLTPKHLLLQADHSW